MEKPIGNNDIRQFCGHLEWERIQKQRGDLLVKGSSEPRGAWLGAGDHYPEIGAVHRRWRQKGRKVHCE